MSELKKKMCKYAKKGLNENEKEIIAEVLQPRFICQKCLRVAAREKRLCAPQELPRK